MTNASKQPARPLALIGGGGHAFVVGEAAALAGTPPAGFLDDAPTASLGDLCPHLGPLSLLETDPDGLLPANCALVICLGDLALRRRIAARIDHRAAPAIVHPSAIISPTALLAQGVFIGPGAIVHSRARVGAHAIINSGAIVEHDCVVGACAHVAPGSALGGGARVGEGAFVGLGGRILPGVTLGDGATLGAGGVLRSDAPAGVTLVGAPARVLER